MHTHVPYIILGLCFKIYKNGTIVVIVLLPFCDIILTTVDSVISDLSMLVSRVLNISF